MDHKLTKEELKDVSDKQFKIVLLIVEEGAEVLIPLLVTLTEFFLYFGWNRNAVPTLASMPLEDLQDLPSLHIPDSQRTVTRTRNDARTQWVPRHTPHVAAICRQGLQTFTRLSVPDPQRVVDRRRHDS